MTTCQTCGCCEGTEAVTPRLTYNRPGLPAIATRVGTHSGFLQTMLARLTSHELANGTRPLQRLTTRDPSDPSVALLDAWAVVADVLTFYQERIANEGYLETATERRSILELGRLTGYRLRPGVSASVYLAFTLDEGYDVTIPAGTLARSLPGPGESAEPFETSEALQARARWNALPLRLSRPYALFLPPSGSADPVPAYLAGTDTGLRAGQMVLIKISGRVLAYVVHSIQPDTEAGLTRITLTGKRAVPTPAVTPAAKRQVLSPLRQLGKVVEALRLPPSQQPPSRYQLARDPARTYSAAADLGPRLLAEFAPALRGPLFTAYANAPVVGIQPETEFGIEALRVSAAPFGATAPLEFAYGANGDVSRREWPLAEMRSSLSVEARSTLDDDDPRIDRVFEVPVNILDNEAAPLELTIRAWDPVSAVREVVVPLSEFSATGEPQGLFRWRERLDGVLLDLHALYTGEDTQWKLRAVTITWQSAGEWPMDIRTSVFGRDLGHVLASGSGVFSRMSERLMAAEVGDQLVVMFDFLENSPLPYVIPSPEPELLAGGTGSQASVHTNAVRTVLTLVRHESLFAGTPEAPRILSFDAEYPDVVPGSSLVVDGPVQGCAAYNVLDVRTAARADYGISQTVTQALLDEPWLSGTEASLADIRAVTIHAGNKPLDRAGEPLTDDLAGTEVELGTFCEGLEAGRWVAVSGERTDVLTTDETRVEGVEVTELAMLAGVEHRPASIAGPDGNVLDLPDDTLHTRLTFAEPLAYTYKRDTARVNANLVTATHGETVQEVIGSGDSASRLQTFALAGKPLTHVPAPTPDGAQSTLEVRAGNILWRESKSLLPLGPLDRGYQSRTDNEGMTSVTFGDGRRGAHLPSGTGNVTARYRVGIGAAGNVAAGQITTLGPKPLGVSEVVNPRASSGGADPETRDQARLRVPLAARALDRLVSVDDYSDFATLYAGIGKAHATRLPDARREVVHVSLAGAADAPVDRQSALWRNLLTSLTTLGDPSVPVVMAPREAAFVFLSAKVRVRPGHRWEDVEPPLREALAERFGFEARALGQPIALSEVVAVIQAAEGVEYVDVDLFDAVTETDAETPETLAARLSEFAARPVTALPRGYLPAALARREGHALRAAQMLYLNPALADSLILTEVAS